MRCSQCSFENRETVRLCEECGAKLELRCSACGTSVPTCNEVLRGLWAIAVSANRERHGGRRGPEWTRVFHRYDPESLAQIRAAVAPAKLDNANGDTPYRSRG